MLTSLLKRLDLRGTKILIKSSRNLGSSFVPAGFLIQFLSLAGKDVPRSIGIEDGTSSSLPISIN